MRACIWVDIAKWPDTLTAVAECLSCTGRPADTFHLIRSLYSSSVNYPDNILYGYYVFPGAGCSLVVTYCIYCCPYLFSFNLE